MDYRRIRDARKALHMTQAELADKTGINRATISKYENGEITPSLGQLEKMAAILGFYIFDVVAPDDWKNMDMSDAFSLEPPFHSLPPALQSLSAALDQLNDEGQEKVIDYADDLVRSGKYKKHDTDELGRKEA